MPYIEKRTLSGNFLEIERFHQSHKQLMKTNKVRIPKQKQSLEKQKKQNIKNAEKKLKRLMHCNFKHHVDLFVGLTFKDKDSIDETTALNEFKKFRRRLIYFREKNNLPPLKYICCIGEDKKSGIHFHLIINKMSWDDLVAIWEKSDKAGRVSISKLEYTSTGLKDTARYFIENALRVHKNKLKEEKDIKKFNKFIMKKWSSSQNLKKPVVPNGYPKIIKSLKIHEVPKEYKHYKTMCYETVATDYGTYQYIELVKVSKMRN